METLLGVKGIEWLVEPGPGQGGHVKLTGRQAWHTCTCGQSPEP